MPSPPPSRVRPPARPTEGRGGEGRGSDASPAQPSPAPGQPTRSSRAGLRSRPRVPSSREAQLPEAGPGPPSSAPLLARPARSSPGREESLAVAAFRCSILQGAGIPGEKKAPPATRAGRLALPTQAVLRTNASPFRAHGRQGRPTHVKCACGDCDTPLPLALPESNVMFAV